MQERVDHTYYQVISKLVQEFNSSILALCVGKWMSMTEIDSENENAYKMMDDFIKMVEYLEKLPKKKFRNIADKDLIRMLDEIEEVHRQKQNNLHLVFDGPKSFMEEDL